jgi:ribosomal-protein-alanine N-acetyltransferase
MSHLFEQFPNMDINQMFHIRMPVPNTTDSDDYFNLYSDPLVNRFVPDDCIPKNKDEANENITYLSNLFHRQRSFYWVIASKKTNQIVGNIGFQEWDMYNNRVEVSYQLHSNYWRCGIMQTALRKVVDFGFTQMKVARIQATTVVYNYPSINLLQKVGFSHEGTLSQYKYYKGEYCDIAMFGYSYKQYVASNNSQYINQNVANVIKDNSLLRLKKFINK